MQDHPGAPGSARQRNPGTDGPAACGGAAVPSPQAPDRLRSRAVPMPTPMPLAPDHSRPGAAPTPMPLAPDHSRPGAAPMPMPLAPPGHAGPVCADRSVPRSTAPLPAHASRLLQVVLRHIAATPRTPISPPSRPNTAHNRPAYFHTTNHRSRPGIYPVHPALLVPTRPPPATASTGVPRQHPSRAPPPTRRKPTLLNSAPAPPGDGRNLLRPYLGTATYPWRW